MTPHSRTIHHLFLILLVCVSGCTISPLRFEAVDADTNQPLAGVILEHYGEPNSEVFSFYHHFNIYYPPSANDGLIVTRRIDVDNYFHGFTFRKSGYLDSGATFKHYTLQLEIYPARPDGAFSGDPSITTSKLDEIIEIPMYRVGSKNGPVYEITPKR